MVSRMNCGPPFQGTGANRRGAVWISVVFCLAIAGAVAPVSGVGDRVALVIGNHRYRHAQNLPNAELAARALARKLRESGYRVFGRSRAGSVTLDPAQMDGNGPGVIDAGAETMQQTLKLFVAAANGAEVAVFYFAGHSLEVEEKNYLVAVDAKLEVTESLTGSAQGVALETTLERETLPLPQVLREANARAVPGIKLIVLDCCRENPYRKTRSWARSRAFGNGGGLSETDGDALAEGTLIVYSAAPGKLAAEGREGEHSPFAKALLKTLDSHPGLGILQVMYLVSDAVTPQKPWIKADGSGLSMREFDRTALVPASWESYGDHVPPKTGDYKWETYDYSAAVDTNWDSYGNYVPPKAGDYKWETYDYGAQKNLKNP